MRRLVLLLGAHRSGTSVAAQAMARAGLPLGDHLLLDRAHDNPEGYWEDEEIVLVQSALLHARFGTEGDLGFAGLADALPDAPPPSASRERLVSIILARLAARAAFGFKDPRTARLLPLWKDIAQQLDIELIPVLVLRNPGAVAASLAARDGLPPLLGELVWLRATTDILRETGDRLVGVLSYEGWFEAPEVNRRVVSRVLAAAGVDGNEDWQSPASEAHWHERAASPVLPLAGSVHEALAAFGGEPPPPHVQAGILRRVDDVVDGFGGWVPLAEMIARGMPPAHDGVLQLAFPGSSDGARIEPGAVTLLNGNSGCRRVRGTFVLCANPPDQPAATLLWRGVVLPGPARLTGSLSPTAESAPVTARLRIARADDGEVVSDQTIGLVDRSPVPIDIAIPSASHLDIRLEIQAADAADAIRSIGPDCPGLVVHGLRLALSE